MSHRYTVRLPLLCGVFVLSALPVFSQPVSQPDSSEPEKFIATAQEPTYNRAQLQKNISYPELARRENIEGMVIVRVLIGKSGKAVNMVIDKSVHPLLDSAAMEAVRKTPFTPAIQGGIPVPVWIQVPVTFRLTDDKTDVSEPSYSREELTAKTVYPESARLLKVEGTVIVRVEVGTSGEVLATRIDRCDHELLCEAARKTASLLTFQPAMEGKRPVSGWVKVPVEFRLK